MRTIGGPFHGVQNECAVATGTRGSAEDIVSAPKGPCGRDRLGPNCFVTLETIRHPLSWGPFFCLPCLKNVFVEPVQNFA